MTTVQLQSLSEIPSVSTFSTDAKIYTTVPVVILAFQKLKLGILLVTDFTDIPELGFAHRQLPQSLPDEFIFNGNLLPLLKVLLVGVPPYRINLVWSELERYGPLMHNYDCEPGDRCNYLKEGIVAILNFKFNVYHGYLEGFLGSMTVLNRARYSKSGCLGNTTEDVLAKFMQRFATYIDYGMYQRMIDAFPIEMFVSLVKLKGAQYTPNVGNAQNALNQKSEPIILPIIDSAQTRRELFVHDDWRPTKSRKLAPSDAVYKQQKSQKIDFDEEDNLSNNDTRSTEEVDSSLESQSESVDDWMQNRVNIVSFRKFCSLECHEISPRACFQFTCIVENMDPEPANVFVKAFRETLKIAPLTFFLAGSVLRARIHINTTEDGCAFFGLEEEEEAINHIGELHEKLRLLLSKEVTIKVEARSVLLPLGYLYMYWGPVSNLSDLSEQ